MSKKTTAQSIAIRHLDALIIQTRSTGLARLPVLAILAADAGVGRVTMWQALQVLRKRGDVVISRGRGVRVADMVQPEPPLPAILPNPRVDSMCVARQITLDLLSHRIDPARSLPTTKHLMRRYAVSYNTMRKALATLHLEGTLTGRRRITTDLAPRSGNATIILMASGHGGIMRPVSPRTADHIRQVELACTNIGVRLKLLPLDEGSTKNLTALNRALRLLGDTGPATGYLIWSIGIGYFDTIVLLVNQLLQTGKRVSLLNESQVGGYSLFKDPHQRLRIWDMAISSGSSQCVARHLLANGHRNVAYLTPFAPEQHTDARLEGLRQGFSAAGFNNAVHTCHFGLSEDLIGLDALEALYNLNHTVQEFQLKTAPEGYLGWKMRQPANRDNPVTTTMRNVCRILEQIDTKSHHPGLFDAPLKVLLKKSEITAWVASNDIVAAECVEFLRRQPRAGNPVTIVGFDDTHLASHFGFTSFNFNGQAVMHAMVHHALGNTLAQRRVDRNKGEEIQGFINVRTKPVKEK